jgi:uncharacterized protein YyaL (SSP411 family)
VTRQITLRSGTVSVIRSLTPILRHRRELGRKAGSLLVPANAVVMARNLVSLVAGSPWEGYIARGGGEDRLQYALDQALDWLCHSQDVVGSGGVGCFEMYGWTSGYPEVTGYSIPTFFEAARALERPNLAGRALRMADWELTLQRDAGGWEGGYQGQGQAMVVFNTGQVLRGLVRAWEQTREPRYLDAAVRGGRWITDMQEPDGSWAHANFKGMRRVYDSYVAAPLAMLWRATGDARYREAAAHNTAFVLSQQHANGWFANADNSPYFTDTPVTHTICYTIDGLIEVGEQLGDDEAVRAAERAAEELLHRAEIWPRLYARVDREWRPAARFVCLTGAAQLGIIFMRLHARSADPRYLNTSLKLVDFLAWVQRLNGVGASRRGGIAGSYPIWGLYCPLKYPSWATKFFVDLLLLVRAALAEPE